MRTPPVRIFNLDILIVVYFFTNCKSINILDHRKVTTFALSHPTLLPRNRDRDTVYKAAPQGEADWV